MPWARHLSKLRFSRKTLRNPWLQAVLLLGVMLWLLDAWFPLALPAADNRAFATVVFDRDGRLLRAFADDQGIWRYRVSLDEVSPLYVEALLTYEDRRFWYHPGIDPLALLRALALNLRHGRIVSGGSTLSMQVARLLHPHSRSLGGKIQQVMRALQLEWHLSKREILTLYCNIAPFGGTIEGVQAASYTYLNKPASELTHAEAALLAVLPQSPTRYRPDLHPLVAEAARNKVLDRLVSLGQWSAATVAEAKVEMVYGLRHTPEQHAPLLARRLLSESVQDASGRIFTTIDGDLQRSLEDYLGYYASLQPEKTSAAALVVDNASGEVLAYVGTAEFASQARFGHVDMVTALRSPGSTLKPFLYALGMDQGLIHSGSLLVDAPQHWRDYRPGNFSGGFTGPVTAASALQRSLNVPAVALLDRYGPAEFVARLQNAGMLLRIPDQQANLAVILGGVGTSLESLVAMYTAFANAGQTRPLQYLQSTPRQPPRYLMSAQAAWVTQHILTGIGRPDGVRSLAAFNRKQQLAWKTGTSYGFRDSWAIGVGRNYTLGVWVGRPDGTPLPGASGRASAGPLLHAIADYLPDSRSPIERPQGVSQVDICWPLGRLKTATPAAHCHESHTAWIINDTVPPTPRDAHSDAANPLTVWLTNDGRRVHSGCQVDFRQVQRKTVALWPAMSEPWIAPEWRRYHQLPAYATACASRVATSARLTITGISDGAHYRAALNSANAPVLSLLAAGGDGLQHWYVNGEFFQSTRPLSPVALTLTQAGRNQLLVVDDAGNIDRVDVVLDGDVGEAAL